MLCMRANGYMHGNVKTIADAAAAAAVIVAAAAANTCMSKDLCNVLAREGAKNRGRCFSMSTILDEKDVQFDVCDESRGIGCIRLNRKPVNALGKRTVEDFEAILACLHTRKLPVDYMRDVKQRADQDVRCVIVHSDIPGVFCAGADLKERRAMSEDDASKFVQRLRDLMLSIEELPIPTIAAVDGVSLGGGLELAMSCDLRIMSESCKLSLPEVKLGIIPGAGGTQRLQRIVGKSMAKLLTLTGRQIDGVEALRIGLADEIVYANSETADGNDFEENEVLNRAISIAREISSNGPLAVHEAKAAIDAGSQVTDMRVASKIEGFHYDHVLRSEDRLEALQAFQEKREPIFTGR